MIPVTYDEIEAGKEYFILAYDTGYQDVVPQKAIMLGKYTYSEFSINNCKIMFIVPFISTITNEHYKCINGNEVIKTPIFAPIAHESLWRGRHALYWRRHVLPAMIQAAWHPRREAFVLYEAGML